MDIDIFLKYLSLYGTDIDRWPVETKGSVRETLRSSGILQKALADEKALEGRLKSLPIEQPSPNLADKIIRRAKMSAAEKPTAWFFWQPTFGLAFASLFLLGFCIGYLAFNSISRQTTQQVSLNMFLYDEKGF